MHFPNLNQMEQVSPNFVRAFPDPYYPEAGALYCRSFYQTAAGKLAPGGLMVTQTLIVPEVTRTVRATVRAVFAHEAYYRADCVNGFTLGSNAPLPAPKPVPEWTDWLSDEMTTALFALPKDAAATFDPEGVALNHGPQIVEAALADGLGRALCSQHSYRPQSSELYVTSADAEDLSAVQVEYLIRGVHQRRSELIVALAEPIANQQAALLEALGYQRSPQPYERYVALLHDQSLDHLRGFWERADNGSVARVESRTCRPDQDPLVGQLLSAYLAEYSDRFFDRGGSAVDLSAVDRYLITLDPEGQPIALFKLLVTTGAPTHVEIEIIYGIGSARQNLLSTVLMITYLGKNGFDSLSAYVPSGVFGKSLVRFGARLEDRMHVFHRPDVA